MWHCAADFWHREPRRTTGWRIKFASIFATSPGMATPRRVGRRWRIEFQVRGQKFSHYADTKQECINFAIETEAMHSGRGFVAGRTVAMLFERYTKEVVAGRKGERIDRVRLQKLARTFGATPVMALSASQVERWRDESLKTLTGATVNRDMNLLSGAMTKAVRWRWARENPVLLVERPPNSVPRTRIFTDDEMRRLVTAMGGNFDTPVPPLDRKGELAIVSTLSWHTAMRIGEIAALTWDHVHLAERYVHVPTSKNDTPRDVPLSTGAVLCLTAMRPRETGRVFKISRDIISNYFRDVRRSIGIHDGRAHDIRRTAITRLSRRLTPYQLAKMSGHSMAMSLRYYNEHASSVAELLD